MEKDIYFEQISISKKVLNEFETLYKNEKEKIINILKELLKEKYNIDIIDNEQFPSKCN